MNLIKKCVNSAASSALYVLRMLSQFYGVIPLYFGVKEKIDSTRYICFLIAMLVTHFRLFLLFRHFNLKMKRDTSIFSPDLIIEMSGEETPIETSHIYSGELFGKSSCFHTLHPHHFHFITPRLSL